MSKRRIAKTRIARVRFKNGLVLHRFDLDREEPQGHPILENLIDWADDHISIIPASERLTGYFVAAWSDRNIYAHLEEDGSQPIYTLYTMIRNVNRKLADELVLDCGDEAGYTDYDDCS